jgi:hypothetical protein
MSIAMVRTLQISHFGLLHARRLPSEAGNCGGGTRSSRSILAMSVGAPSTTSHFAGRVTCSEYGHEPQRGPLPLLSPHRQTGPLRRPVVREKQLLGELERSLKQLEITPATLSCLATLVTESDKTETGDREQAVKRLKGAGYRRRSSRSIWTQWTGWVNSGLLRRVERVPRAAADLDTHGAPAGRHAAVGH